MPDADALLMQAQQAKRLIVETQQAEEAKFEVTKASNTAGRLYRLLSNDDVQWFLAEFMDPLIADEDKILNDRKTPTAERDIACHRKDMAVTMRGLLSAKHQEFVAKAGKREG